MYRVDCDTQVDVGPSGTIRSAVCANRVTARRLRCHEQSHCHRTSRCEWPAQRRRSRGRGEGCERGGDVPSARPPTRFVGTACPCGTPVMRAAHGGHYRLTTSFRETIGRIEPPLEGQDVELAEGGIDRTWRPVVGRRVPSPMIRRRDPERCARPRIVASGTQSETLRIKCLTRGASCWESVSPAERQHALCWLGRGRRLD